MEVTGVEPVSESALTETSPGAEGHLHSLTLPQAIMLQDLVASSCVARAKLTVRTFSTQITPEPGSWTFRGGRLLIKQRERTDCCQLIFKRLPVLSWPGATARYSGLTTPVETGTPPYRAGKPLPVG